MAEFLSSSDFDRFNKANDERFAAFGARIASLESLREDMKTLDSKCASITAQLNQISKDLKNATDDAKTSISTLQGFVYNSSTKKINDLTRLFDQLKEDHAQLKTRASASETETSNLQIAMVKQNAKFDALQAIRAEVSVIKMDIVGVKETASKHALSSATEIQKLTSCVDEAKSAVLLLQSQKDKDAKERQEISAAVKNLNENVGSCLTNITTNAEATDAKIGFLKTELFDKIGNIPVLTVKEAIPESRITKIESQLEMIALDAKNAFLKSGNVDMQTQLHSKKIENIQLLLKQHELTQ